VILAVPPPPQSISDTPDQDTALNPDFTGDHARNRILHVNTRWFKYGTDDKAHASAMVLSALLLLSALFLALIGAAASYSGHEMKWLDTIVTWIGNAFLFTSGIAVGKGGKDSSPPQT
jgi:hypothetical protein